MGEEISDTAYSPGGRDARKMLDEAEKKVFDIAEMGRKQNQGFASMSTLLGEVMTRLDELSKNPNAVTGVETGFKDLDERTSGMHAGDLIIVAGRPSMGKTAFSLNIAEHVGVNLGVNKHCAITNPLRNFNQPFKSRRACSGFTMCRGTDKICNWHTTS